MTGRRESRRERLLHQRRWAGLGEESGGAQGVARRRMGRNGSDDVGRGRRHRAAKAKGRRPHCSQTTATCVRSGKLKSAARSHVTWAYAAQGALAPHRRLRAYTINAESVPLAGPQGLTKCRHPGAGGIKRTLLYL